MTNCSGLLKRFPTPRHPACVRRRDQTEALGAGFDHIRGEPDAFGAAREGEVEEWGGVHRTGILSVIR